MLTYFKKCLAVLLAMVLTMGAFSSLKAEAKEFKPKTPKIKSVKPMMVKHPATGGCVLPASTPAALRAWATPAISAQAATTSTGTAMECAPLW